MEEGRKSSQHVTKCRAHFAGAVTHQQRHVRKGSAAGIQNKVHCLMEVMLLTCRNGGTPV